MMGLPHDRLFYKDDEYVVLEYVGGDFITPEQFGMRALPAAHGRNGYVMQYEIDARGKFCLRRLSIHSLNGEYYPVDGVEPRITRHGAEYESLNVQVPFTGKLRIRHFYYDTPPMQPLEPDQITRRARVLDVTLRNGEVAAIKDRSTELEKLDRSLAAHFDKASGAPGLEALSLDND